MTNQEASMPATMSPPIYREIPLNELSVDHAYQREVDTKWVKRTAKAFDPALLGVLMVASNGNGFKVWDGQHRLELLKTLGFTTAMCQVVEADVNEQAALFSRQANRRNLTWWDRHRAGLVEGNKIAQEIDGIILSHGLRLASGSSKRDGIRAIGSLYRIYARDGADVLSDTLELAAKSWAGSPQQFADRCLVGVATFYAAYPPGDDNSFCVERDLAIKVFQEVAPSRILDDASKLARTPSGSNNFIAFASLMVKHFNHQTGRRLRSDRLGGKS